MAKKSSIVKERRREALVKLKHEKRSALKLQASNVHASEDEREAARVALNKMPKNSSPVRLHNRCQLTGRARGYYRKFKISRLCFREMASNGLIPGVTKSSW